MRPCTWTSVISRHRPEGQSWPGFEALELQPHAASSPPTRASYRTSVEGVFAVGDATNQGASIAIEAIGEARRCAKVVDLYLHGVQVALPARPYLSRERHVSPRSTFADYDQARPGSKMPTRPAEERKHDFQEINLGFSEAQARAEAARCLDCGCHDLCRM